MDLILMGSKIKKERKQQKFTLDRLAEKIGISRNFMWEIEAGRKTPALMTLYSISKILNLSMDYMVGLSNKVIYIQSPVNEHEMQLSEINKILNSYGTDELKLTTKLLSEFLLYLVKK